MRISRTFPLFLAMALTIVGAPSDAVSKEPPKEVRKLSKDGYIIKLTGPPELSGVAERPDAPGAFAVVGDGYKSGHDIHKVWVWAKGQDKARAIWPPDDGKAPRKRDREAIDIAFDDKKNELRMILGEGGGEDKDGNEIPPTLSVRWNPADGDRVHQTVTLDSAAYKDVQEISCGRGLEGMSLRWHVMRKVWQLALMWEGGKKGCKKFLSPLLGVLEWAEGPRPDWSGIRFTELKVSGDLPDGQTFRAPDLAWKPGGEDLIVLLASSGLDKDKAKEKNNQAFCHTHLQMFDTAGNPKGKPLVIRERKAEKCKVRKKAKTPNWEALDTVGDECLVMGYDHAKPKSYLVVFPSPFMPASATPDCSP